MSASSAPSPALPPAISIEAPEFSIVEPRGTLKIPLTTSRGEHVPLIDVSAVHVEPNAYLPVATIESAHRALAPAAGVTRSGCDVLLFGGQSVPAVEFVCDVHSTDGERAAKSIENSERFDSLPSIQPTELGSWIERFRDAGIHADRRGSPDLLGQLVQAMKRPIDTVLCSLLDSDPTACLQSALAREFAPEIVAGTILVSRIVGATRSLICADQRMPPSWLSGIRASARKTSTQLISLPNDYPQSDPTLLLFTLLNRRLRPGRSPIEQGVVLLDAAAAFAIGRRFLGDELMTHVPLAVRDHARKLSHFILAPIGMSIGELLNALGEAHSNPCIRGGDLLRDITLPRDAVVSGAELVIHSSDPEPEINPDACIRCGWCMEACPTRVQPAVVLEASQREDRDMAERAGIEACIECGICSYVCPSKLPLLEGIRGMKGRHGV